MLHHGTTRGKSRRSRLAGMVLSAGLVVSVSGCGLLSGEDEAAESQGGDGSVEKSAITVAHLPSIDVAPLYYAESQGYFDDEGLDVTIEQAASGQAATQKMLGGDADFVQSSYVPFMAAHAKGTADIKIVSDAVSAAPDTFVLVAEKDGPVTKPEDLEGKKIAVSATGTIADTMVMSYMKANGLDHESVEFVQMSFPDIAAGVANGDVAAGTLIEPFITMGAEAHGVTTVADIATGPTEDFPLAGYGALAETVEQNPKTVAAFQRAMEKATNDVQDREIVEPVIQETAGIDADIASLVNLPNFHATLDASRLQRVPDLMVEFGLIDEKLDADGMIARPDTT
ncbi:sulfonate ABC transporter substrate-binding protein [Saccharomonospora piscinae]|uniref:Sulfonate ABC transporter substrate-binding protein n=1 Tax=Saccharomonospora piscinae TaxID=687388 RepID=A0A1V9A6H5_SACPI|nr:ABC transporter substrate-binding protein [Saccharomonospora piscinae]OQO92729.1 sulfonate ABC transporter substrate-binding protein [Saccharomonospora piscinae]TLW92395.1 ABC transporter substrate-binding protein [Saccharomonospora piscinae]